MKIFNWATQEDFKDIEEKVEGFAGDLAQMQLTLKNLTAHLISMNKRLEYYRTSEEQYQEMRDQFSSLIKIVTSHVYKVTEKVRNGDIKTMYLIPESEYEKHIKREAKCPQEIAKKKKVKEKIAERKKKTVASSC